MNVQNGVVFKNCIQPLLFAAITGLLATGCATYQQQNKAILYWQHGDLTNAVVKATKKADENANNKDAIVWRLEQGAVLRANGQYADSNQAFDQAQVKIDDYAQKAKVRIGQEAGALLSNQANLDYEGRSYDGIMLNTYKALNYLALGEPDKARPELIRAYQRQQDAVEDNKKSIEKVKDEAAKSKDKATMDKAEQDPKFKSQMQGAYTYLDDLKAKADYENPFTAYLYGLFFMATAADLSDLEHAHKSFELVGGFLGNNDFVKADLAAVDDLMNGKQLTPTTYVIFETGSAPIRDQIRIDIPTFWPQLPYLGAAFPKLKFQNNYVSSLTVTANRLIVTTNNTVTTASNTTTTTNDAAMAITGTSAATNDTVTTTGSTSTATNNTVTSVNSMTTTTNDTTVTSSSTTTTTNGTTMTASSTTTTADITATTSSTTATTSLIASMDSVIGLDLKNELPAIITKTLISTTAKAVATHFAWEATRKKQADGTLDNGGISGALILISASVWSAANNIADERTWTTLPKEFQVCRIPTPPDRKIELETPGGGQKIPVTVGDGTINVIYVKSISPSTPLLVTQMKLK